MQRQHSSGALLLLLLVLSGCRGAGPFEPAPPDDPFDSWPDLPEPEPGSSWIYVANADGSNLRPLVEGTRPAWSPDGRSIAFERGDSVYLIGSDRTERLVVVGRQPAWSPDARRIAFVNAEGIAVINADGSNPVLLLRHDFRTDTYAEWDLGVAHPAWSPDGSLIAFEHQGDGDTVPAQLFLMSADGAAVRRVTPVTGIQYAESDPAWSPDGQQLVFWSYGYGLAVAPRAGGVPRTIYQNFPAVSYGASPAWSPDGTVILVSANRFAPTGPAIWGLPSRGGVAQVLIELGAEPSWAPSGARIAFDRIVAGGD